jgi:hypothetical protein
MVGQALLPFAGFREPQHFSRTAIRASYGSQRIQHNECFAARFKNGAECRAIEKLHHFRARS